MPNRLATSLSPYLLQHAHNPVDWFPWGEEALAKARAEDKPIFLSIGYSACHWCHVMERESFENPDIAALLNRHFVPVKVDREERPDLDDLYMDAVQMLTGRGGWPMSVWLTPELRPFFGGTYFPPSPGRGMPGFQPLLERIAELWTEQRETLVAQAGELAAEMRRQAELRPGEGLPDAGVFEGALGQLRQAFDSRWGGFGAAPKFPQHLAIQLILRRGSDADREMAVRTLDAMWEGGMYDHLGGGFSRYSVDGRWLVPHFEKMLYDNAQLACCYLDAFQASGERRYATIARECLDYLLRDLADPSGGFHSSEDADSEGEEGRFYVFTPGEVADILGAYEGDLFCAAYGITPEGNFEHGASVLHRFSRPADLAERNGIDPAELEARLEAARRTMFAHRCHRVRPGKDDKLLASWNGLALSALARGARILGETRYRDAAARCAGFIEAELGREGGLLRVWRQGRAQQPAFLEDYAAVANGLVDLYECEFDESRLRFAGQLATELLQRFQDEEEGGFFSTEAAGGDLLFRQKPGYDNALPSGNTLAIQALLRLGAHLDRDDFRRAAARALAAFSVQMARAPRAFLGMLAALDLALEGPVEVTLAGAPENAGTLAMLEVLRGRHLPNLVLSAAGHSTLPLHRGRTQVGGKTAAYVCRQGTCASPVTTPADLAKLL